MCCLERLWRRETRTPHGTQALADATEPSGPVAVETQQSWRSPTAPGFDLRARGFGSAPPTPVKNADVIGSPEDCRSLSVKTL